MARRVVYYREELEVSEEEERFGQELVDAAREGRQVNFDLMPETKKGDLSCLGKTVVMLFLACCVAGAMLFVSARTTRAEVSQQANCNSTFDHHKPDASPYLARIASGKVWASKLTGDVIAAVWIAECGKYLIAIYRGGYFNTHFLTSWGYVKAQVAGMIVRSWATVTLRSFWFIAVPCRDLSFVRPCPEGNVS